MTMIIDSLKSEGLGDFAATRIQTTVQATAASTLSLTVDSTGALILTGSTSGQIVRLGDATTYQQGHCYFIVNASSVSIQIQDNSSALLLTLDAGQRSQFILQDNTTSTGIWVYNLTATTISSNAITAYSIYECFDDLDWTTLGSGTNPHSVVSVVTNGGLVTVEGAITDNNYFGRISIATGTTNNATGHAALDYFNSVSKIRLGGLRVIIETRVMIPTLSTNGQPFIPYLGFQDGNAFGAPANGVFFSYNHNVNAGQWTASARTTSTSSTVNSTVLVNANQWYILRADINAAASSVTFYIDGTSIGSVTTNIPVTNLRPVMSIDKSGTSNQSRIAWIDYVFWKVFR